MIWGWKDLAERLSDTCLTCPAAGREERQRQRLSTELKDSSRERQDVGGVCQGWMCEGYRENFRVEEEGEEMIGE